MIQNRVSSGPELPKSRKERRKEDRQAKLQKRSQSWFQHQALKKIKKNSSRPHVEDISNPASCESVQQENGKNEEIGDKTKRITTQNRRQRTKFEQFLEIGKSLENISAKQDLELERKLSKKLRSKEGKLGGSDDGINDILDGIPFVGGLLRQTKHDKENESEKYLPIEDNTAEDLLKSPKTKKTKHGKEFEHKDKESSGKPTQGKSRKRRTKFEEYLLTEVQPKTSGDDDFATEKKLVKKLKVKDGRLGGSDDGLNDLLEGIPFCYDLSEDNLKLKKRKRSKTSDDFHIEENAALQISQSESPHLINDSDNGLINEDTVVNPELNNLNGMFVKTIAEHDKSEVDQSVCKPIQEDNLRQKSSVQSNKQVTSAGIVGHEYKAMKYVPPHLRSNSRNESSENAELRRKIKGLLNRLSESNVESIAGDVSTTFQLYGRSLVAQVVGEEVLASCSNGPRGNEQYASVFAAFVSGISASVGMDFGAKFLASLASLFEEEYRKGDSLALRNLALLLSHLYIFGLFSSDLMYDLLALLTERLEELDVATILNILQCCGMVLRSDDPAEMKDFVVGIQEQVQKVKSLERVESVQPKLCGKRMEFMLETICDIKNNKKRAKDDRVSYTRLKKWLHKLRVEDVQLQGIKWAKLLDPDKKGQWWLSGDLDTNGKANTTEIADAIDAEIAEAQKMLRLAAEQRMNTEARRAIFCIIMSADDYLDAFEKILRLNLPGKQDREILRVLVECCLQEKVYNKYYSLLAAKLCSYDKNHKYTLQYCAWDHFKQLDSMELRRSANLARFLADLIGSFSLSITVLKTVDFTDPTVLTSKVVVHFHILFESLLCQNPDNVIWNIFTRIAGLSELENLQNGLKLFFHQCLTRSELLENQKDASGQKLLANKIKVAKKALSNVAGVLL